MVILWMDRRVSPPEARAEATTPTTTMKTAMPSTMRAGPRIDMGSYSRARRPAAPPSSAGSRSAGRRRRSGGGHGTSMLPAGPGRPGRPGRGGCPPGGGRYRARSRLVGRGQVEGHGHPGRHHGRTHGDGQDAPAAAAGQASRRPERWPGRRRRRPSRRGPPTAGPRRRTPRAPAGCRSRGRGHGRPWCGPGAGWSEPGPGTDPRPGHRGRGDDGADADADPPQATSWASGRGAVRSMGQARGGTTPIAPVDAGPGTAAPRAAVEHLPRPQAPAPRCVVFHHFCETCCSPDVYFYPSMLHNAKARTSGGGRPGGVPGPVGAERSCELG